MKLSNAQQAVMDDAKAQIDFARTHSLVEWFNKVYPHGSWAEQSERDKKYWARKYDERKNGYALSQCNSRTLYKLAEYGLIEIVKDSNGQTFGIDVVKVLNY